MLKYFYFYTKDSSMKKIQLTLLILFLGIFTASAQPGYIKALEKSIETANNTEKLVILEKLSEFYLDYDITIAIKYAGVGLKISKKEKADDKVQASFYNKLGAAYYYNGKYRKSLRYYEKELFLIQKDGKPKETIKALYNIAVLYQKSKKYRKAAKYFELSYEKAQELKSKDLIMHNLKALYEVYEQWGKDGKSLKYLQAYIALKDKQFKKTETNVSILRKKYKKEKALRQTTENLLDVTESKLNVSENDKKELTEDTLRKANKIELLALEKKMAEKLDAQEEAINSANVMLHKAQSDRKAIQFSLLGLVTFLVLAAGVWLFYLYRQKRKANDILLIQKEEIEEKTVELTAVNVELEEKNTQIIDSINYARRIQDSILIPEDQIKQHLPETFIYYQPKDIVSGDFYWFSEVNGKFILAAIDCTGHGVPGAFMSMIGNTLLNEIVNEKNITKPDEILAHLHEGVMVSLQQNTGRFEAEDGMDMSLCTIDPKLKRFQFAGAKNHLYVIQGERLKVLKANHHSIGGRPLRDDIEVSFTSYDFMYDDNTSIYMMSDGYMDQFGGLQDTKFNSKRFKQMLLDNCKLPMAEQKDIIKKQLNDWKGDKAQIDDILVLGVKL